MSPYVLGVIFALAAPAFSAAMNIFDSHLSNNIFKRLTVLVWMTALCYVLFLPFAWLWQPAHFLPLQLLVIAFLIALTDIFYQFPYYWALRRTDTSIVVSLFSMGKVFVPLFAYLLVREALEPLQYVGFFLIIFSAVALSLDRKKFRFNIAFFHMAAVSFIMAGQIALYKYAFSIDGSWSSVFSAAMLIEFIFLSLAFFNPDNRRDLKYVWRNLRRVLPPLLGMEVTSFIASMLGLAALSLIPATVASGLGSIQPLFALAYAEAFAKNRKKFFHESLRSDSVHKKVGLFFLIFVGTLLIAAG